MYKYSDLRPEIFTENGQRIFLEIRDHTKQLLRQAGAARAQEMMARVSSGNSWVMLACIDRMVELGELREVTNEADVAAQHRVFVSASP